MLKLQHPGMKHTNALEILARSYGFKTYASFKAYWRKL